MGRWQDDPQGRLAAAAFDLFTTRGYEATTGAQIAAAAGLHERSFFRHFPDKRDALFANWDEVVEALRNDVLSAEPNIGPGDVVQAALGRRCDLIAENPEFVQARVRLLSANAPLAERDRTKHAELSSALSDALRERGADDESARLVPFVSVELFRQAVIRWAAAPTDASLRELFEADVRLLGRIFS